MSAPRTAPDFPDAADTPAAPALRAIESAEIAIALGRHRFRILDEDAVQRGVAEVLDAEGITYRREHRLGPNDRIDFLTGRGLGIEVKVRGTAADLFRQLRRYAAAPEVSRLLVVTTRAAHRDIPFTADEVPVHVAVVRSVR